MRNFMTMLMRLLLVVFTYIAYIKVSAAQTTPNQQLSPEEAKGRRDWAVAMHKKGAPKNGCFTTTYPGAEWREVQCVPTPNIPFIPRLGPRPLVVGNTDDISAGAPSGTITQGFGHFENPVNVTSESGMINNTGAAVSNAYSLQVNTNFMTSTACAGSPNPGCQGWEQWVYFNNGTSGVAFIQYWLIKFNATCPAGWGQFMFSSSTDIYCFRNNSSGGVGVPNQPITNIANWTLSGTATTTGDSVGMFDGTTLHTRTGDNSVNAAANWTEAEFNIFGPGGGSQATFNNLAQVDVRTEIFYGGNAPPICLARGTTGETNNLSFGPTAPAVTGPGAAVIFTESGAGGAGSNCAAATTVGDTHLNTYSGLFYDFQASGDFVMTQLSELVGPSIAGTQQVGPTFVVQARQASGAPTWPNAAVNHAIATQMGPTRAAVCLTPTTATGVFIVKLNVDGTNIALGDGSVFSTPDGVDIWRFGNVYTITDQTGNSVRAAVHPTWLDVSVGLGQFPASVAGPLANPNGNVNQIATSGGTLLMPPFDFGVFYLNYGQSWRVAPGESLLSACEGPVETGNPQVPFYAISLNPAVYQRTRAVCTAAGVNNGALLDACTLDVAVIGDDTAAQVFVNARAPVEVGNIVSIGPTPLSIATASLGDGQIETPYSFTLSAIGGTLPYFWQSTGGRLPTGLVLNSATGQITGTPHDFGQFSVSFKVTDSSTPPMTASINFTLNIAPTVPLAVTTASLPDGKVGTPYSVTLARAGGTAPFHWALSPASTLPAGLSLNAATGEISGTPAVAVTNVRLVVILTDSGNPQQTAAASLRITIAP